MLITASRVMRRLRRAGGAARQQARLVIVELRARGMQPGAVTSVLDYKVRVNDGRNFYILYKDIFVRRLYAFNSDTETPRILDCGSNIGLATLFFKHVRPKAKIICFEPDPSILPYLEENVRRNGLSDVEIREAAIAGRDGTLVLYSDGRYASSLEDFAPQTIPADWQRFEVPCVRLRDCLAEPIDLVKMNIEGAEAEAIVDAASELRMAKEFLIEYHHLPGLKRSLHTLLAALDDAGFDYLVHSFDSQTSPAAHPPFRLTSDSRYFVLVYASRRDRPPVP
jgi:FkbM family methyltransferase